MNREETVNYYLEDCWKAKGMTLGEMVNMILDDCESKFCINCIYYSKDIGACDLNGDYIKNAYAMKCNSHERIKDDV